MFSKIKKHIYIKNIVYVHFDQSSAVLKFKIIESSNLLSISDKNTSATGVKP